MRTRRLLATVVAGFVGAALLLGVASLLGLTGTRAGGASGTGGAFAAFKSGSLTPQQIYQNDSPSVVEIQTTFPGTQDIYGQTSSGQQALGTGFVVSKDGYILTNAHVVSENGQAVSSVTVLFKTSGSQPTSVTGTVVGADESTDVALIKVDPSRSPQLTPIALGDSSKVAVGESVVAIGNPLGLDFSLSTGVVSATGRDLQSPNGATISGGIQTDAAINPGNSGGPLINADGRVIGINEQIDSQSGGNEGVGFAVPINTAVSVMKQILAGSLQQAPAQSQSPYGDGSSGSLY